jgi:alkanesulfonate monooxygenase SsuD/methylene tetrahydromethanopterin reductase-like flavin-dependent oxidoreductase (luciferase family)
VAALAERSGFDSIIPAENAHGPFLPLAAAALVTDRVRTAVAMEFPHAPTIMAHGAWNLNLASKGRFYLGLGARDLHTLNLMTANFSPRP